MLLSVRKPRFSCRFLRTVASRTIDETSSCLRFVAVLLRAAVLSRPGTEAESAAYDAGTAKNPIRLCLM